ncbi:MAG: hypothetical protein JWL84_4341 [Rhodospirillales bacterium]|nr:hypothetical protein [Rhodospirillales bacterium]
MFARFAALIRGYRTVSALLALPILAFVAIPPAYRAIESWSPSGGMIFVDMPQIYSRARLVNDRFDQNAWLTTQLDRTFKKDEKELVFGDQAILDLYMVNDSRIAARGAATLPNALRETVPATGESPKAGPPAQSGGDAAPTERTSAANGNAPRPEPPVSSPIELFHDILAYREDVRTEMMETMLDDGHDIRGNTIYRLKFDTTILPSHGASAWAVLRVRVANDDKPEGQAKVYADWIRESERELLRSLKLREIAFLSGKMNADDLQDFFRFLLRRVEPGFSRGELVSVTSILCDERLSDRKGDEWSPVSLVGLSRCFDSVWGNAPDASSRSVDPYFERIKRPADYASDEMRSFLRIRPMIVYYMSEQSDSVSRERYRRWRANMARASQLLAPPGMIPGNTSASPGCAHQSCADLATSIGDLTREERGFLRHAIVQYMIDKYELRARLKELAHVGEVGCEIGDCRFILEPLMKTTGASPEGPDADCPEYERYGGGCIAGSAIRTLFDRLDAHQDSPIYAYAVTPKESVQRISELSASVRSRQLLLAMSQQGVAVNGSQELDALSKAQRTLGTINRRPLVVGFGNIGHSETVAEAAPPAVAEFGWLLGPRADFDPQSGNPAFLHTAVQHGLSAIISLPSWWSRLRVDVTTCWIAPDDASLTGSHFTTEVCRPGPHVEARLFSLRVPYTVAEVQRKLGYTVDRVPHVEEDVPDILGYFYEGDTEDVRILIPGGDLWRSTVVTMGAQRAKRIEVLPNMKGIIADFDHVPDPVHWEHRYGTTIPVSVWTSEGETSAGFVCIVRRSLKETLDPPSKQAVAGLTSDQQANTNFMDFPLDPASKHEVVGPTSSRPASTKLTSPPSAQRLDARERFDQQATACKAPGDQPADAGRGNEPEMKTDVGTRAGASAPRS